MSVRGWNERLLATTRGKILALLRRQPRTVQDLAEELEITANTVRSHLATLERDGLVQQSGTVRRPGAGKPAHMFELVPEIEPQFSKAYIPLLGTLLDVLEDRLGSQELLRLMTEVGQRLAPQWENGRDLAGLVNDTAALLDELGAVTTVEREHETFRIKGRGCPLSAVVCHRPEVCSAVLALIEALTGGKVVSRCERGERPQCYFEIAPVGD